MILVIQYLHRFFTLKMVDKCAEAACQKKISEQTGDDSTVLTEEDFNLNASLTDNTGTLNNVKLGDEILRKMIKCSVRTRLHFEVLHSILSR